MKQDHLNSARPARHKQITIHALLCLLRKEISEDLTKASNEIDHAQMFEELPGNQSFTHSNLKAFMDKHGKVATACQERLIGIQARARSRQGN